MGEPSDSMAGSESSFGGFQNSNNNSSSSCNVDFWFGMFKATSSNQNDFSCNMEMPRPSSRDDQWGHVFEQWHPPKKKSGKHNKKKRKMNLDMGSNCSAVNSTSDVSGYVSEALSEALSAISADLSLSSSSSSSHTSSQKSDQNMDPNKWEMSIEEKHKLGAALLSLPKFEPVLQIIKKRNKDIGLEGDEIVIDIDALDMETLWELQFLVTNYKKMARKSKRQALMGTGTDMSTAANNGNEMLHTLGNHSLPLERNDSLASDSDRDEMPNNSVLDAGADPQKVNLSVPEVGKEFASEEEAYNFYKRYANRVGFNVRKGKVQRSSSGDIRKRYFFCSREGFRSKKHSNEKKRYKRKETRTGCSARMECTVKNGNWVISQFFEKHNHDLDRMNTEEARLVIHSNDEAEMEKVSKTTKVVKSCSIGCFTNEQDKKACGLRPEGAQNLMDRFRRLQAEDPSFFHAIQLDEDCRLTNIFWSDGMSKIDYHYFGDVLILDTTFKVNKHGRSMICAPFWGVNHHRQFILFGCALLFDNSTNSFIWLFETFMQAMGRRQPKSIFTDEGEAIGDAVKLVMPEAQHQIGMWYIHQNASKHLSAYFGLPGFKRLLNECISDCETEEEFESRWSALLAQFNLHGNEWLVDLQASRDRWSPIFSRKTFSAGIQCHASIESIFQNLPGNSSTARLSTFVEQYLTAAKLQRREEWHEDFRCNETEPNMILPSCPAGLAEKQAAIVYTCAMFKVFQKQLPILLLVKMDEIANDGRIATFKLSEVGKKEEFFVEFNCLDSSVTCSCKKYECEGILCVHALKVLNSRDMYEIPPQYILKRWTKSAKKWCSG